MSPSCPEACSGCPFRYAPLPLWAWYSLSSTQLYTIPNSVWQQQQHVSTLPVWPLTCNNRWAYLLVDSEGDGDSHKRKPVRRNHTPSSVPVTIATKRFLWVITMVLWVIPNIIRKCWLKPKWRNKWVRTMLCDIMVASASHLCTKLTVPSMGSMIQVGQSVSSRHSPAATDSSPMNLRVTGHRSNNSTANLLTYCFVHRVDNSRTCVLGIYSGWQRWGSSQLFDPFLSPNQLENFSASLLSAAETLTEQSEKHTGVWVLSVWELEMRNRETI